jgi:WD40 repeat protein
MRSFRSEGRMVLDLRCCRRVIARSCSVLIVLFLASVSARAQKHVFAKVEPNAGDPAVKLTFDVNVDATDNIAPNIVLSRDGKTGFVAYAGSGTVLVFSMETGDILGRTKTGGKPAFAARLPDDKTLAVVSAVDNKIFTIDMQSYALLSTYSFTGAQFGFGSVLEVSPDGKTGYISSTGTGEVLKFSLADGKETGRLKGLEAPAQITATPDGTLLLVVDALLEELVLVDPATMTKKSSMKAKDKEAAANFTIFNRAVLAPDGTTGIIASRDVNGLLGSDTVFHFKTATGEILDTTLGGAEPGFTTLTPDGKYWVVFCDLSLVLINVDDFKDVRTQSTVQGDPLGSSNVVFSSDSRYAFYASSSSDQVFQHDLTTGAVVGQVRVGDNPNTAVDQPSALAITPNGKVIAVLDFVSNNIELLEDAFVLDGAKYISNDEFFTGLSLINLSQRTATFTIIALNNYGEVLTEEGVTNPIDLELEPNHQVTVDLADLLQFPDTTKERVGWLAIFSEAPKAAGYVSYGDKAMKRLDGVPLFREPFTEWVVPEIVSEAGKTVELNFVNPNYNQGSYDLNRYSGAGAVQESQTATTAFPTNRQVQVFSEVFTQGVETRVLIAGGELGTGSVESYDPATGVFTASDATLSVERRSHSATRMRSGKVLLAGGTDGEKTFGTADLYDPETEGFQVVSAVMTQRRQFHTATLLPDGNVLLAGGSDGSTPLASAEIYDPTTKSFRATGSMTAARTRHTATLLRNGKVLIAGGESPGITIAAELYDYRTGRFTATGSMAVARSRHTATLLRTGEVLVIGGADRTAALDNAELYDVATGSFALSASAMSVPRQDHTATLLTDGTVLISGGRRNSVDVLNTGETYDPATDGFVAVTNELSAFRADHTATLLPNGNVLLAGGTDGANPQNAVDVYDSINKTFTVTGTLVAGRAFQTATLLPNPQGGYLRIKSKFGLLFTEILTGTESLTALNGIDVSKFTGVTKLYSPQFAVLPGFNTVLNLINGADEASEVTITLHGADGAVISTVKKLIPMNGQLRGDLVSLFSDAPEVRDVTGWIEVEGTLDPLMGTITFGDDGETYKTTFQLQAAAEKEFVFPIVAQDDTYYTGTALLNPGSETATVTVELWGPGGTLDRTTTFSLAGKNQTSRYLSNYFPNLEPRLTGNIRVRSDKPLYGIAVINDGGLNFLAAVPPIPLR